jgi:GMP synthase-like glutamine amidotransferase
MRQPTVLIIQNDAIETLGWYETYLKESHVPHHVLHAYQRHEAFPAVEDYDAFIVGPTPLSANAVEDHAFLVKEWAYLRKIIRQKKPCLGVCCGAQLLAKHLGAKVARSPHGEIGGYVVRLTRTGHSDALFAGFPAAFPVFHWHSDVFTVPPGGSWLVAGEACPVQAFGWGRVRGVLFHLEIAGEAAARWCDVYEDELAAVGKTRVQVVAACREHGPAMRRLASRLMANFLQRV